MRRIVGILFLFLSAGVCAAQGIIVQQHLLDSIAEPPMARDTSLLFENETLDVQDIKGGYTFKFGFRNVSDSPVTITAITPSCSCLSVNCPRMVTEPGEAGHIEVKYSPAGHVGHFNYRIFVYTGISSVHPAVKLEVSGEVVPDGGHKGYPVIMGPMRLKRGTVSFGEILPGTVRKERIACVNGGSEEVRLRAFGQMCPEWVDVRTEPEVMAPGAEGDIVVTIDSSRIPENLEGMFRMSVILDGIQERPSVRSITVEAVLPSRRD